MAANEQLQLVVLQEVPRDVRPKRHAHAALAGATPSRRLRITPQQLAHQSLLRWLPAHTQTATHISKQHLAGEISAGSLCFKPLAEGALDTPAALTMDVAHYSY